MDQGALKEVWLICLDKEGPNFLLWMNTRLDGSLERLALGPNDKRMFGQDKIFAMGTTELFVDVISAFTGSRFVRTKRRSDKHVAVWIRQDMLPGSGYEAMDTS